MTFYKKIMMLALFIGALSLDAINWQETTKLNTEEEVFSRERLCDCENQLLDDTIIRGYLTESEALAFRLFRKTVKEQIEVHFRNDEVMTPSQIKNIIWGALKKSCIRTGTSFSLFACFVGSNILYSWGVEQVPYTWLASTLYTFQTIIDIAVGAPILTPIVSHLTQSAFNFRELKKSSAIMPDALDKLWHKTNEELSMNGEMSRNLVVNFTVFLGTKKNRIEFLVLTVNEDTALFVAIAKELALFTISTKRLFPELPLDNELVEKEVKNFTYGLKNLVPNFDREELFLKIENEVESAGYSNDDTNKIKTQIKILENYWKLSRH